MKRLKDGRPNIEQALAHLQRLGETAKENETFFQCDLKRAKEDGNLDLSTSLEKLIRHERITWQSVDMTITWFITFCAVNRAVEKTYGKIIPDTCRSAAAADSMTFADQLRDERQRLGLTQAEAATLLDVARDTVAAWESQRNTPIALTQEGALARLRAAKRTRKQRGKNTFSHRPSEPEANEGSVG